MEPDDPSERIEPSLAIDRIEPVDRTEQSEPASVTGGGRARIFLVILAPSVAPRGGGELLDHTLPAGKREAAFGITDVRSTRAAHETGGIPRDGRSASHSRRDSAYAVAGVGQGSISIAGSVRRRFSD
jgi:hypothetical protein